MELVGTPDKSERIERKSRRLFIRLAAACGLAGLIAPKQVLAQDNISPRDNSKRILLTADGRLVEVEKQHLPDASDMPCANADIKEWMKNHKDK